MGFSRSKKQPTVTAFGAMIGWLWGISFDGWIPNAGVIGTALGF